MICAELDGEEIVLNVSIRQKEAVRAIPGSRYRDGQWRLPATWAACVSLRSTFGDQLQIGRGLSDLGWKLRERRDSVESGKLKVESGPYGFQEAGIHFLYRSEAGILADEMGLGKSRQAILAATQPVLIICPKSVMHSWKKEVETWVPYWKVAVLEGNITKKRKVLKENAHDVYIVNYDSLRTLSRLGFYGSIKLKDEEKQNKELNRPWGTVIVDEAHRIKDPKAKQTRAVWTIGESAERRYALTGTPIANSPVDLWSILHFVSPEEFPSRTKYIDRYCESGFNFWGGLEITGFKKETREELDSIITPRFFRRTKEEVLPDLPPKVYQTLEVDMPPKQRQVYLKLQKEMIVALDSGLLLADNPLTHTIRLLQAASAYPELNEEGEVIALTNPSCKISALEELLDGRPTVIFTVSRKLASLVALSLEDEEVSFVSVWGGQTPQERADNIEWFQGGAAEVALVTTGAGGEGITLTGADRAIFLQRPWSMVQSMQAEDRLHRIGQDAESVHIIDVVARETIEGNVHEALREKGITLQELVKDKERLEALLGKTP